MKPPAAIFLPERSPGLAVLPWLSGALTVTALSLVLAGGAAWRPPAMPDPDDAVGAELVITFAPVVTMAESRPQLAAAESAQPEQQARPEVEEVRSQKQEDQDLPTEQASPAEPEPPDLHLARERTQQETDAPPENVQATERAEAQPQVSRAEASVAAEAAVAQHAEAPQERTTAPDTGNAQEAARRIEAWQRAIFSHIGRFKTYPEEARRRNMRGEIVVAFALDRKGKVSAIRIETGSGFPLLDKAAMEVLAKASPLPAPPPDMRGEVVELLLPMRYQLR